MTTIMPLPETLVLRVPPGADIDADGVSLRRLRAAAAGGDREWPQSLAMAWLCDSDFPNKHRDYAQVLQDGEAGPEVRCLAAHYLGRIGHPAVQDILIAGLDIENDQVRSAVLAALARVGGPPAFDAIRRSSGLDGEILADRVSFALALIACRHDQREFDLPMIEEKDWAPCPATAVSGFRVESADPAEVELCLRCLGPQPFSIEFAERSAYQIRCGGDLWMILFNRAVATAGSVDDLRGRKHFVGIVARRTSVTGGYAEALVVLAGLEASKGRGNLVVYRASGGLAMAGSLAIIGGAVEFHLRSTLRPRAFTVDIEGAFKAGSLQISRAGLGPGEKQEAMPATSRHNRLVQAG